MRLLGLMVCCFGMNWFSPAYAGSDCNPNSSATAEIVKCINSSYKLVDKKLHDQYRVLVSTHQFLNKKLLLEGERAWVRYKDSNCSASRSLFLGNESGVEELGCRISLTASRLVELIYRETGTVGDGFYSSLSVIGGISSKSREEIFSYIERLEHSSDEVEYYKKNCELTEIVHGEEARSCLVRMKFQNM